MRKPIPREVMRHLRHMALSGGLEHLSDWRPPKLCTQETAARRLGCSEGTVLRYERDGGTVSEALSFVGLAFMLGGEERARRALERLAQTDIEGIQVAVRR